MAFEIPTLTQVAQRAANAFRSNLKGSDASLWPNNVAVSAKVMGLVLKPVYDFVDYTRAQIFASTADYEHLLRHGADLGMAPLAATFATGEALIAGDPTSTVPTGIVLQRADGLRYETLSGGTISEAGTLAVAVRALTPGKSGNCAEGVSLTFIAPRDRLATTALVSATGVGLGADAEGMENFRQRILFRKRMPPHGGAAHDYIAWVRDFNPAITRVYVDPVTALNGRTSVGVWFLMDGTYPNGIPRAADVAGVAAYIDTVRPAGALVEVMAPVPVAVDIPVSALTPDTVAVREAVRAELADLFRRDARVATLTDPHTLFRSQVDEAISIATGERNHAPALQADVVVPLGKIPVLGAVTFS